MGQRILVMNDTQEILDLFCEILEEEGYQVTLRSYSTQDLSSVQLIQPDLIIAYCCSTRRWLERLSSRFSTSSTCYAATARH